MIDWCAPSILTPPSDEERRRQDLAATRARYANSIGVIRPSTGFIIRNVEAKPTIGELPKIRRAIMRVLAGVHVYRNASRSKKTRMRRRFMAMEVGR